MNPVEWAQLGVGIAAVAANVYIVRLFLGFLGNHLSKLTKSLDEVARRLERIEDRL